MKERIEILKDQIRQLSDLILELSDRLEKAIDEERVPEACNLVKEINFLEVKLMRMEEERMKEELRRTKERGDVAKKAISFVAAAIVLIIALK